MSSWCRACPTSTLPIADGQAFQLERIIDGYDTINLAVRMLMVLARILFLGVEVDASQRHVKVISERELDLQE